MAFIEKHYESKGMLFLALLGISLVSSTNIDCNEKSFHCVNSTHFMICVDLGGGVSTTIDDFIIPCPPTTECKITNKFECEFLVSTTPAPILRMSDVTNELEISVTTVPWEEIAVTSMFALNDTRDLELSDLNKLTNESLTALPDVTYSVTLDGSINANESTTSNETSKVKNTLTTTMESHIVEAKVTQVLPKNSPRMNTAEYTLTTTTESHITEAKVTQLLPQKKLNFTSGKNDAPGTQSTENAPPAATKSIHPEVNVSKLLPQNILNSAVTNIKTTNDSITDKTIVANTTVNTLETITESIYNGIEATTEILQDNLLIYTDIYNESISATNTTESTQINTSESIYTETKVPAEPEDKQNLTDKSNPSVNIIISTNNAPKTNATNYTVTPTMESIQTEINLTPVLPETEFNFTEKNNRIINNKMYSNTSGNTLSSTTETIYTEAIVTETLLEYKWDFTNTNASANFIQNEHRTNPTENTFITDSINTKDSVTEALHENTVNFIVTNNVTASDANNEQETKTTAYNQIPTTESIFTEGVVTEILSEKPNSQNFTNTSANINLSINEHGMTKVTPTVNSNHAETNANELLSGKKLNSPGSTANESIIRNDTITNDTETTFSPAMEAIQIEAGVTEILLENILNFTDTNSAYTLIATNNEPKTKNTANAMMITTESIYTDIKENVVSSEKNITLMDFTNTNDSTSVTTNEITKTNIEHTVTSAIESIHPETNDSTSVTTNEREQTNIEHTVTPTIKAIHAETNADQILQENKLNLTGLAVNESITNNKTLTYDAEKTHSPTTETIQTETNVTKVLLENTLDFIDANNAYTVTATNNEPETKTAANDMMPRTESMYTEIMETEITTENKLNFINLTNTSTSATANKHRTYISEHTVAPAMNSNYAETEVLPVNNPNSTGSDTLTNATEKERVYTESTLTVLPESEYLSAKNNDSLRVTTDTSLTPIMESTYTEAIITTTKGLIENKTNLIGINNAEKNIKINQTVTTIHAPISTSDSFTHENFVLTESLVTAKNTNDQLIGGKENVTTGDITLTTNKVIIYGTPNVPTAKKNINDLQFYTETAVNQSDTSKSVTQDSGPLTTLTDKKKSAPTVTVPSTFNETSKKTVDATQTKGLTTIYSLVDGLATTMDTTVTLNQNTGPASQTSNLNLLFNTPVTELTTQEDISSITNARPVTETLTLSNFSPGLNETTTSIQYSLNNELVQDLNLTTMNSVKSTTAATTNNIMFNTGKNETEHTLAVLSRTTEYDNKSVETPSTDIFENPSMTTPEVLPGSGNIEKDNGTRNATSTSTNIFSTQGFNTTESEATSKSLPIFKNVTILPNVNTSNDSQYLSTTNGTINEIHATNQSFDQENTVSGNWQDSIRTEVTNNITTMPFSVTEKYFSGQTLQTQERSQNTANNNITNESVNTNLIYTSDNKPEDNVYLKLTPLARTNATSNYLTINKENADTINSQYSPTNGKTNSNFNKENTTGNWLDSIITEVRNNITTMPSVTEKYFIGHTLQDRTQTTATINTHIQENRKYIASVTEMTGTNTSLSGYFSKPLVNETLNKTEIPDHELNKQVTETHNTINFLTNKSSSMLDKQNPERNSINNNLLRSTPFANNGIATITKKNPLNPIMNVLFNMSTVMKETGTPITHEENSYIPGQFTTTETMLQDLRISSNNALEKNIPNTSTLYSIKEDNVQVPTASILETSYVSIPENLANRSTQILDKFTNSIQSADNATVQPVTNTNPTEDFASSTTMFYESMSPSPENITQFESGHSISDRNILSVNNLEENRTLIVLTPTGNKSLHDSRIIIEPPAIENVTNLNEDLINNSPQVIVTSTDTMLYTKTATFQNVTNKSSEIGQTVFSNMENSPINSILNTTQSTIAITQQKNSNNIKTAEIVNRSTTQVDIFTTLIPSVDTVTINPVQNKNDTNEFATSTTFSGENVIVPDISMSENSLYNGVQLTTTRSQVLHSTAALQVEDSLTEIKENKVVTLTNIIPGIGVTATESIFDSVKMGISADDMHHLVDINRGGLHITSSGLDIPSNVQGIEMMSNADEQLVSTGMHSENMFIATTPTAINNVADSQNKYTADSTFLTTLSPPTITVFTNSLKQSTQSVYYNHEFNSKTINPDMKIMNHNVNTERVSNSRDVEFGITLENVGTTESTFSLIEKLKSASSDVTTIKGYSADNTARSTDTPKSFVSGVFTLPNTYETIDQVNSLPRVTITPLSTLAYKFTAQQIPTTSIYDKNIMNSIGNKETNTESLQNNFKVKKDEKSANAKVQEENKQVITTKNYKTIPNIPTTITTEKLNTNVNYQISSYTTLASTPVKESSTLKHSTKADNVHVNEKETAVPTSNFDCQNRARGRYGDYHDCRKFYICIGRPQPIVGLCPVNTVFSENRTQCTKNMSHCIRENQFQCPAEGRFIDYLSDNIYYICVKSRPHFTRFKFQCQKGYHLDKKSVKCLKNIEASTQALPLKVKPVSNNGFICKEQGKFPDPDIGMNIYYMCVKNGQNTFVRFKFQCQKGYHLNKTSVRCLQDILEPISQSVSSKDSVSRDESVSIKQEFKCKEAGKFADPDDCRKYYMCSLNKRKSELRRKKKKCDSDEVFSKDKKKCVDTDSYEC